MSTALSTKALSEISLTKLCSTLEAMIPLHQNLLSLLQDEKRLIVDGDTEALIQCAEKKEGVLKQVAELEKQRIEMMQGMDDGHNPLTLRTLIPICPPQYRKRLQSVHLRLEAVTASIQELNQMNGLLVGRVLGQISGLLGILDHLTSREPIYEQTGKINTLPSSGRTFGKG